MVLGKILSENLIVYRFFDVFAPVAVRLVVIAEDRPRPPVRGLLELGGQGRGAALAYDAPAVDVLGLGQHHDAVAYGADDLAAGLLGLGEVLHHELVHDGRVDDLPHALLVAAGEDDEVERVEGEARRAPRQRVAHLVAYRHLLVLGDDFLRGTLLGR